MDRAKKAEEIKSLSERFDRAKAAFLVDFKGMNVEQVTRLRIDLRRKGSEMKVFRNTLAKLALKNYPDEEKALSEKLTGTNAFVFAYEEAPAAAKLLSDFSEDVEHLVVKGGVLDGTGLDQDKIKYLATLPSKDVLRGQLLGLFNAPASKFVRQLAAPAQSFVRVLGAYKDKQS